MCIFSFRGCKHRTYSWRSNSIVFLKCISDDQASRNMGHNQSKNYENLRVCRSKLYVTCIHGKLNQTEFCGKFCRIYHLRRLPVIIIDVLFYAYCLDGGLTLHHTTYEVRI